VSVRFYNPRAYYTDGSGEPLAGGQLFFFLSDTSTPTGTWNDDERLNLNSNPIILDSAGRLPNDVFLDPSVTYKVVLKAANDVTIWTADPVNDPNAESIVSLETRLTTAEGNITANASAVQSLDTRVDVAEGDITAQATAITALEADITDLNAGVTGNASAITTLDARVTTAEGDITANASAITALESSVTSLEFDVSGNASAITALDTRVTTAEGNITSQASSITTLESDVSDLVNDVSGNATAISGLQTDVTALDGQVTSLSTSFTTVFASNGVGDASAMFRMVAVAAPAGYDATIQLQAKVEGNSFDDSRAVLEFDVGDGVESRIRLIADRIVFASEPGALGTIVPFAEFSDDKIRFSTDVEIDGNLVVYGIITADEFALGTASSGAPWLLSHPSFRNGIREGGEWFAVPKPSMPMADGNNAISNSSVSSFSFCRYPDYVHMPVSLVQLNGTTSSIVEGAVTILPGRLMPSRFGGDDGPRAIHVQEDGFVYYRLFDVTDGTVTTETLLGKSMWPLELDPLNTKGLSTVVAYQEWAHRPVTFVVPAGKTTLRAKLWGAGGGDNCNNINRWGGPGGFAQGDIPVTPGEVLVCITGEGGTDERAFNTLGFGGGARKIYSQGGGLTGIFRGAIARANALLIAGGGGGARSNDVSGSPGGHTTWAGGNGDATESISRMTGVDANEQDTKACAGGGGYEGGGHLATRVSGSLGGRGGTNFAAAGVTSTTLSFASADGNGYATTDVPPNTGDADYAALAENYAQPHLPGHGRIRGVNNTSRLKAGGGLAVLEWL